MRLAYGYCAWLWVCALIDNHLVLSFSVGFLFCSALMIAGLSVTLSKGSGQYSHRRNMALADYKSA